MLQQTQVKTVIPYWERWLRELPDVAALAAAPEQRLLKLWEGLGYYTRVRNLQKAAQHIVARHRGVFPRDFPAILELPGVGRYTAGAIASIAFNQPTPILDGNVIRVLTRVFGIAENPREAKTNARLWLLAENLVGRAKNAKPAKGNSASPASRPSRDANYCSQFNQSLMELGALVCTPQQPRCDACPVRTLCVARRDGLVGELPNLAPRATTTRREFHAFVIEHAGNFLVTQRPAGVVNAGLWEFPNREVTGQLIAPAASLKELLHTSAPCEPLCEVRHSITRYRIRQRAFHVRPESRLAQLDARCHWMTLPELLTLPFTSAHKRILARLEAGSVPKPTFSAGARADRSSS